MDGEQWHKRGERRGSRRDKRRDEEEKIDNTSIGEETKHKQDTETINEETANGSDANIMPPKRMTIKRRSTSQMQTWTEWQ
jgi:hypothetical protein